MTEFNDVIEAWQRADVEAIHPLRAVDEKAYWESGKAQAKQAAEWIPKGGTVVDFGCGDGRLTLPLIDLGFKVVAMDASTEMLKRLRDRLEGRVFKGILQSNGLNIREVLHSNNVPEVDTIVCRAVLIHHSHEDVARLVGAFASVLDEGGHLVADWPVARHYERQNWTDVTTWEVDHRRQVAAAAGLELVSIEPDQPSVWRKCH